MPRYQILHNQFCSLARESKFQKWLEEISVNLYSDLMKHLESATGCKANVKKMQEIQQKLQTENKSVQLVDFLLKNYPSAIVKLEDISKAETQQKLTPTIFLSKITDTTVFKYYYPNLLTYPMKAVFTNEDVETLRKDVKRFMADKIDADYIVVGNKAYVEYFKTKHMDEAKLVPRQKREIFLYRLKQEQENV
jgi:hypothetical protein